MANRGCRKIVDGYNNFGLCEAVVILLGICPNEEGEYEQPELRGEEVNATTSGCCAREELPPSSPVSNPSITQLPIHQNQDV